MNYEYKIYKEYENIKKEEDLINDNKKLALIFEWYVCVCLTKEYDNQFYHYKDIPLDFIEDNNLSKRDTGIDLCNLKDTIVQCKLRKDNLTLTECSTFFASQNAVNYETRKSYVRWDNLIIARNDDSKLSEYMKERLDMFKFIDITYNKLEMINFCENLLINPPIIKEQYIDIEQREYQEECKTIIQTTNHKNIYISIPTGTGKTYIAISAFLPNEKYIFLVPRIILLEQTYDEIKSKFKYFQEDDIQMIGDGNNIYNKNKKITLCVYNSIDIVLEHIDDYNRIFIDEAHNILKPLIYQDEDDINSENTNDTDDVDTDDTNEDFTYIKKIQNLSKKNNNVYFSATLDNPNDSNSVYYKKDIRDMIEQGYICDYDIRIPVFQNINYYLQVSNYLISNFRNVIIYVNSRKDGLEFKNIMNKIKPKCSNYIDYKTTKAQRKSIIKLYNDDKLPFLINVRVLTEGFDSRITQSVCLLHIPSNHNNCIQIVGRALRKHPNKSIAHIIAPMTINEEHYKTRKLINMLAQNDRRIMTSLKNKKQGGYINVEVIEEEKEEITEDKDEEIYNIIEQIYEKVYDSLLKYTNEEDIWNIKYEILKEYNKKPTQNVEYKNIKIGQWYNNQKTNYKKNKLSEEQITKLLSLEYFKEWTEEDKKEELSWDEKFMILQEYCDKNKTFPTQNVEYKNIKIGEWYHTQKRNYTKNKLSEEQITKLLSLEYFKEWTEDYKPKNKEELSWDEKFMILQEYCDKNKTYPKQNVEYKNIKIGIWYHTQKTNYKKNKLSEEQITKLLSLEYFKEWTKI